MKITITIEDLPGKKVDVKINLDPPAKENDPQTPAYKMLNVIGSALDKEFNVEGDPLIS